MIAVQFPSARGSTVAAPSAVANPDPLTDKPFEDVMGEARSSHGGTKGAPIDRNPPTPVSPHRPATPHASPRLHKGQEVDRKDPRPHATRRDRDEVRMRRTRHSEGEGSVSPESGSVSKSAEKRRSIGETDTTSADAAALTPAASLLVPDDASIGAPTPPAPPAEEAAAGAAGSLSGIPIPSRTPGGPGSGEAMVGTPATIVNDASQLSTGAMPTTASSGSEASEADPSMEGLRPPVIEVVETPVAVATAKNEVPRPEDATLLHRAPTPSQLENLKPTAVEGAGTGTPGDLATSKVPSDGKTSTDSRAPAAEGTATRQTDPTSVKSRGEVSAGNKVATESVAQGRAWAQAHAAGMTQVPLAQAGSMARYLDSGAYLRPVLEAVTAQRSGGIRSAHEEERMSSARSTNTQTNPPGQNAPPVRRATAVVPGTKDASPAAAHMSTLEPTTEGLAGSMASLTPLTQAAIPDGAEAGDDIHSVAHRVERLEALMTREAGMLHRTTAQSVSVVLRPDPQTELLVHFEKRAGGMEATVRCDRGDLGGMGLHWNQLREALAAHDIRLLPYTESSSSTAASSSVTDGNSGSRSATSEDRRSHRQPVHNEPVVAGTPSRTVVGVHGRHERPVRPPGSMPRGDHWETWA